MENTARIYFCVGCRCQVKVCRCCDHGNQYCGEECAQQARSASLRAAGKRYQQSRSGRHRHAERQRKYRARVKKVTHQGSPEPAPHDVVPRVREPSHWMNFKDPKPVIRCHFCGGQCSEFLRRDYLRSSRSYPSRST